MLSSCFKQNAQCHFISQNCATGPQKQFRERLVGIPAALWVWGTRCWRLGHISLHCPGLFCFRPLRPSQTENPLTDEKQIVIQCDLVAKTLFQTRDFYWGYPGHLKNKKKYFQSKLTSSNNPVAKTGSAHWLQFNPTPSVDIVERTHAARCGGSLFSSVETKHKEYIQGTNVTHNFLIYHNIK